MINKILNYIAQSVKDSSGKVSHIRISSYVILLLLTISSVVFNSIDMLNAIQAYKQSSAYTIPYEHITLYAFTLTHHLIMLGLKKAKDTDYITHKNQP